VTIWVGDDDEPHRTSGNDRATVALAAAEVLRGYLVAGPAPREPATGRSDGPGEAGMTPATERDAGESTATEPTIADDGAGPEGTTVTARAGLAVFLSAGGVSDQLAIELGVAARVAGNAHLEVVSAVGVPGATITGKREDTPVWTATLGAGLGYVLLGDEGPLTLVASAGIAGLLLLIEDNEKTLVRGAALPYLHAAAGVRIVDGLSARFDATGAIALPEPEVRLSAGRRPSFGRPLVTLGLGLALDW
jgi:hypothetical protein